MTDELLFTAPPDGAERLDKFLAEAAGADFSRSRIQGLIKSGMVAIRGKAPNAVSASMKLAGGEEITLSVPPPVPAVPQPEAIDLRVLFEDAHILVVDKPAGLVVHPAPGHLEGTLVNAVLHHCPGLAGIGGVARPGIVHRLDQDTSGVMIVAKTENAMRTLVKEFSSHANIKKTYLAIVHGAPAPRAGRIENLIGRSTFDRKKMAVVEKNGKLAVTNYTTLATHEGLSLVKCEIETGRTHQIRVHMASLGAPVVFDAVYGHPRKDAKLAHPAPRQLLHAWKLALKHPVTREPLEFTAPAPDDFYALANARKCVVSLGSNLGQRMDNLKRAIRELSLLPATRLVAASSIAETQGVDVPETFKYVDFLNQAAIFQTLLGPQEFSDAMHAIETALGRRRGPVRNTPRTIDIDLIDFEGVRMATPDLVLPHPRATSREFVMAPLRELGWRIKD